MYSNHPPDSTCLLQLVWGRSWRCNGLSCASDEELVRSSSAILQPQTFLNVEGFESFTAPPTPSSPESIFGIWPFRINVHIDVFRLFAHQVRMFLIVNPVFSFVAQEAEPASCYPKVSKCRSVLEQDTEPQTAPDVLVGTLHGSH